MQPRVLLALPEPHEAEELLARLEEDGLLPELEPDAERAVERCRSEGPWDLLVADTDGDGRALLESVAELAAAPAVVLVSSFGSVRDAVESLRAGASDYLCRPTSTEQLVLAARRALEQHRLAAENQRLRRSVEQRFSLGRFTTRDPRTRAVLEVVEGIADTRATVLIQGESGTGKSLLARVLHERSERAQGPFVVVNCGALPAQLLESELFGHVRGAFTGAVRDKPGRFEEADGGTLFLDEISTASPDLQVKLLRALQDRVIERVGSNRPVEVDVRFVLATNRDLAAEVEAGRFREDLYYRIHVVTLDLPALRERPGDVPLLAEAFRKRYASEYGRDVRGFSEQALTQLCSAPWPGNVRQLENAVERAILLARGHWIQVEDLGNELAESLLGVHSTGAGGSSHTCYQPAMSLKEALEAPERRILTEALELNGWSRQRTAAMLGINRTTLFNKMRKYQLLDPTSPSSPPAREAS